MNRKSIALFVMVAGTVLFLSGCGENKKKPSKEKIETSSVKDTIISELNKTIEPMVAKPKSEETTLKKVERKITFIELGSVKCIPCRQMQPIMEEIKKEYGDQVDVVFYDVWTEQGKPYAEKYRIMVIPTQIFLDKEGSEYFRHSGFFPKDELIKVLKMKDVK